MLVPELADVKRLPEHARLIVPVEYLDIMGHMNVQYYMRIFLEASWDFFGGYGLDEIYLQAHKKGLFALEHHIRYFAEVAAGNEISVFARSLAISEKRVHYMCFMVNESRGKVAASFESVGAYVDMTTRRSAIFSAEIVNNIQPIAEQHQKLKWAAPICGSMRP